MSLDNVDSTLKWVKVAEKRQEQIIEDDVVIISGPGQYEEILSRSNLIGAVFPRESIFLYSREILGADGLSGHAIVKSYFNCSILILIVKHQPFIT